MAYLRDSVYTKQNKNNNYNKTILYVLIVCIVFIILRVLLRPYFFTIAVPVIEAQKAVSTAAYGFSHTKANLISQIQNLQTQNEEFKTRLAAMTVLENENSAFKNSSFLKEQSVDIVPVLLKPSYSVYDTLVLDTNRAFALDSGVSSISGVPIGFISFSRKQGSTATLYSSPGISTKANIVLDDAMKGLTLTLAGQGGGLMKSIIPEGTAVPIGSLVYLSTNSKSPFAEVVKVTQIEDTKEQVLFIRSLVNFQYLRYVAVNK